MELLSIISLKARRAKDTLFSRALIQRHGMISAQMICGRQFNMNLCINTMYVLSDTQVIMLRLLIYMT